MYETITQTDILRAVTELSVAELQCSANSSVSEAVHDACEALIAAGLIPLDVSPEVWRCVDENNERSVETLRQYINTQ